MQGVTTVITNNDGGSPIDIGKQRLFLINRCELHFGFHAHHRLPQRPDCTL
jgi:hypothetical protein